MKKHDLTAGEVADLLYVPGCQQTTQETVETPAVAKEEPKSEEQFAKQQSRRHHRGGWKHRKPVSQTTMPNAAVPPTVKRPARSPMENLKNIVMRDPSLGQELLAVLRKHDVSINQIFEE